MPFFDCTRRNGSHVDGKNNDEKQEPVSRSEQVPYIPVTTFSQTDLF